MPEFKIEINNRAIIVESASFVRTMDTGADACNVVMPWIPGFDATIDKITAPYSYSQAKIYIDNVVQSEMILYDVTSKTNNSGTVRELDFYSKTADIIDSTVIAPYEMNNVKLTDRCRQQCNPYGISVIVGEDAEKSILETRKVLVNAYKRERITYDIDLKKGTTEYKYILVPPKKSKLVTDEKKFPRVKAEPTETIFSHLSKLASQRGLLLSCTKSGDLLITTANINSKPVGTIEEEKSHDAEEYIAKFSGRNRFKTYRAIVKSSSSRPTGLQTATDSIVKSPRLLTFNADNNIPGEAKNSAIWRKNKSAADAMSISFPVNSWYAPNGTLWQPNTTVTIISKTINTGEKGFTYLITRVEFKYSSGGCTAVLELKPPSMYGNGVLEEPWL